MTVLLVASVSREFFQIEDLLIVVDILQEAQNQFPPTDVPIKYKSPRFPLLIGVKPFSEVLERILQDINENTAKTFISSLPRTLNWM